MDRPLVKTLALCLALAGLAPARGELIPVGEEIPILDSPGCNEEGLDIAPLPGGGFVAVWARRHPDPAQPAVPASSLSARVIGGDGQGRGPAQRLAGHAADGRPAVTVNEDGRILVAWHDPAEAGGAVAQLFDIDGGLLLPVPGRTATVIPRSSPTSGLDAAPLEDGFAVLVTEGGSASLARFGLNGALRGSEVIRPPDTFLPIWSLSNPRLVSRGSSGLVAAWNGMSGEQRRIEARVLGVVPSPVFVVRSSESPGAGQPGSPAVASGADGNFFVAWREDGAGVYGRAFDGAGTQQGDPVYLLDSLADPALATDGGGGFVLAGIQTAPIGPPLPGLAVALLSPQGVVLSTLLTLADLGDQPRIEMVRGEGQRLILAWEPMLETTSDPCHTASLSARLFDLTSSALTLQEGRFQASVRWTDHQGQAGQGQAVPLTGDSGYFWFFGPNNLEVMVKVLDGRAVNNRFWVFYASLSDVAYTLTVTDAVTGVTREYQNPAGQLASRADTVTFAAGQAVDDAASPAAMSTPLMSAPLETLVTLEKAGPCIDPSLPVSVRPGLCLGYRFEVEVSWRNPLAGTSGAGQGVQLTTDSGYLWFFGANNVELVVKVLDGRAVNGHFWVFYGAMSNVEYTVQVRDTLTGAVRTYRNPPGQLASRADTEAF